MREIGERKTNLFPNREKLIGSWKCDEIRDSGVLLIDLIFPQNILNQSTWDQKKRIDREKMIGLHAGDNLKRTAVLRWWHVDIEFKFENDVLAGITYVEKRGERRYCKESGE